MMKKFPGNFPMEKMEAGGQVTRMARAAKTRGGREEERTRTRGAGAGEEDWKGIVNCSFETDFAHKEMKCFSLWKNRAAVNRLEGVSRALPCQRAQGRA